MKKKIMITGSSGFLGSRIALYYRDKYELLLPTHAELNISREEAVRAYIEEHQPDIVVHCAALSNTWYCEQHPEESHRVNVQGTVRIAKACKLTGAKLIFMSSDQVYNGTPLLGPLAEDAMLQPVNVYGRHKLEAEQRALWNLPDAVGLRLTWMYDSPDSPLRLNQNILVNLQTARLNSTPVKACTHELRGLTDVWQVVRNIEKALALPGGIYNFGSENRLNTYETYLRFAAKTNTPASLIIPDDTWQRNLSMSINKLRKFGIDFPDTI